MKAYIFQSTPLVLLATVGHVDTAAKDCVMNAGRAIIANDVLHKRFKASVMRRNALNAYNRDFLHFL